MVAILLYALETDRLFVVKIFANNVAYRVIIKFQI